MVKTVVIKASVYYSTTIEGETLEEIEEKAQDILENQPLEDFDWDEGDYEILDEEEVA